METVEVPLGLLAMSPQPGLTVAQTAELLGVSRQQIHYLIKTGRLKVKELEKVPGRGRIILDRASVNRELKRRDGA